MSTSDKAQNLPKPIQLEPLKSKLFITKSNNFLKLPKDMNGIQRNILNAILTRIKINDDTSNEYIEFTLKEVSIMIGLKEGEWNHYEIVRKMFESMQEIKFSTLNEKKLSISNLISKAELIFDGMAVRCFLTDLALNFFVRIQDINTKKITSYTSQLFTSSIYPNQYTHEIWDTVSQLKTLKNKSTLVSIQDFREKTYMPSGLYTNFAHFQRRILEPAKEQINNLSGIKIDYTPYKLGNKVVAFKLFIVSIEPGEIFEPMIILDPEYSLNSAEDASKLAKYLETETKFSTEEIRMISREYPISFARNLFAQYAQKGGLFADPTITPEIELIKDLERIRVLRVKANTPKYRQIRKTSKVKPDIKKQTKKEKTS